MLTQNTLFSTIADATRLSIFTQTRTDGGSVETDVMLLTVTPNRPPLPSVVTTQTDEAALRIPSRKADGSPLADDATRSTSVSMGVFMILPAPAFNEARQVGRLALHRPPWGT